MLQIVTGSMTLIELSDKITMATRIPDSVYILFAIPVIVYNNELYSGHKYQLLTL